MFRWAPYLFAFAAATQGSDGTMHHAWVALPGDPKRGRKISWKGLVKRHETATAIQQRVRRDLLASLRRWPLAVHARVSSQA